LVAAPLALRAVEVRPVADRDEDVLQAGAARMVRVHVARRGGGNAEGRGQLFKCGVSACVAALERTLQLDVERIRERACKAGSAVRIDDGEPVPRSAGETDEPVVVPGDDVERCLGGEQLALAPGKPRACVRIVEDPAEV